MSTVGGCFSTWTPALFRGAPAPRPPVGVLPPPYIAPGFATSKTVPESFGSYFLRPGPGIVDYMPSLCLGFSQPSKDPTPMDLVQGLQPCGCPQAFHKSTEVPGTGSKVNGNRLSSGLHAAANRHWLGIYDTGDSLLLRSAQQILYYLGPP